jgi:magnesium-transporting ATPase (P-type)
MDLVLGDIVQLRLSVKFPADMRMLWLVTSTLRVKHGSLTSEANSINKIAYISHRVLVRRHGCGVPL